MVRVCVCPSPHGTCVCVCVCVLPHMVRVCVCVCVCVCVWERSAMAFGSFMLQLSAVPQHWAHLLMDFQSGCGVSTCPCCFYKLPVTGHLGPGHLGGRAICLIVSSPQMRSTGYQEAESLVWAGWLEAEQGTRSQGSQPSPPHSSREAGARGQLIWCLSVSVSDPVKNSGLCGLLWPFLSSSSEKQLLFIHSVNIY